MSFSQPVPLIWCFAPADAGATRNVVCLRTLLGLLVRQTSMPARCSPTGMVAAAGKR